MQHKHQSAKFHKFLHMSCIHFHTHLLGHCNHLVQMVMEKVKVLEQALALVEASAVELVVHHHHKPVHIYLHHKNQQDLRRTAQKHMEFLDTCTFHWMVGLVELVE